MHLARPSSTSPTSEPLEGRLSAPVRGRERDSSRHPAPSGIQLWPWTPSTAASQPSTSPAPAQHRGLHHHWVQSRSVQTPGDCPATSWALPGPPAEAGITATWEAVPASQSFPDRRGTPGTTLVSPTCCCAVASDPSTPPVNSSNPSPREAKVTPTSATE